MHKTALWSGFFAVGIAAGVAGFMLSEQQPLEFVSEGL